MKKHLILGALALSTVAGLNAQTTDVYVTGATAFRGGFTNAMNNTTGGVFVGGPISQATDATSGSTISKYGVWTGNVTGVAGLVRIFASFSGSVEGIRDLVTSNTTTPFFPADIATPAGNHSVGAGNATITAAADLAFSDAFQASTVYKAPAYPLAISTATVGVLPFVMVTNENAPASFTNVNAGNFRTLFQSGYLKLSNFTGNASDSSTLVFATGRYNLSGTRIIYLAETGVGAQSPVNQYKPIGTNTTVTALRLWPTVDGLNASTVDQPGNGGWEGSGTVRGFMGANTSSVEIQYADGSQDEDFPVNRTALMLSAVGSGDVPAIVAANATGGGKALSYNGVAYVSANGTAIGQQDVYNGSYTLWGYEHLYYPNTQAAPKSTVRTRLVTVLDNSSILGSNGLRTSLMNVVRSVDGAAPTPISSL